MRKTHGTKMKVINYNEKEKILKESYEEGRAITELGKKYGISAKTIYGWRRLNKNLVKDKNIENPKNFIEVAIKEDAECRKGTKLKKVELVYEKLRIEIEGEISSAKIGSLMQILEGE